jgi:hypothetical protein
MHPVDGGNWPPTVVSVVDVHDTSSLCAGLAGADLPSWTHAYQASPLRHGLVHDWSAFEQAVRSGLDAVPKEDGKAHADSLGHPLVMAIAGHTPPRDQERLLELLYEQLDVPSLSVRSSSLLSLYCSGRTTGVVVEITFDYTSVRVRHLSPASIVPDVSARCLRNLPPLPTQRQ